MGRGSGQLLLPKGMAEGCWPFIYLTGLKGWTQSKQLPIMPALWVRVCWEEAMAVAEALRATVQ